MPEEGIVTCTIANHRVHNAMQSMWSGGHMVKAGPALYIAAGFKSIDQCSFQNALCNYFTQK